jgi:hypothetical protein
VGGGRESPRLRDRGREHDAPQAEDDLDFARQVEELGADARCRLEPGPGAALLVRVLDAMSELGKGLRREGVENRESEDRRRDQIERVCGGARGQNVPKTRAGGRRRVRVEGQGEGHLHRSRA